QQQYDVWGAVLDSVYLHTKSRDYLPEVVWPILKRAVECAIENWKTPDRGIWEVRGEPQHFTSSKLMCWVALDRGARLAEMHGDAELARAWQRVADEIKSDICERGVDERGVFVQHYGGKALDASVLLIPLIRFLQPAAALRRGDRPSQWSPPRQLPAGVLSPGADQRGHARDPRRVGGDAQVQRRTALTAALGVAAGRGSAGLGARAHDQARACDLDGDAEGQAFDPVADDLGRRHGHDVALPVHDRPAAVARADRGRELHVVAPVQAAVPGAAADRDGPAQAERRADGHHCRADPRAGRQRAQHRQA